MREAVRSELVARVCLTLGGLLPYWPLLTFQKIHVPDDGFMSDLWNGELPGRVWLGATLRAQGALPSWNDLSCSGTPVIGAEEPLSLLSFWLLPPAAALSALLITWVLVAAHGTYALSRALGAERAGAVLAGIAFAGSGYVVTQLKHLGIVGTVAWLPLGLYLLERGLGRRTTLPQRGLLLSLFGLLFAMQALAGFPQSAYISALCYAAYAAYRQLRDRRHGERLFGRRLLLPLLATAAAGALGAAAAAVVLLPFAELSPLSDRAGGTSFEWASFLRYAPIDALTFLLPYANGDASNATYRERALFWEDYGYVGLATFLLALYAALREPHRRGARFFAALAVLAYLLVLGPATPVFRLAFELLPGMKLFRFPTRFLVVVDLALCVLAAIGLSGLQRRLSRHVRGTRLEAKTAWLAAAICLATALDLFIHQPRQNPFVDADAWLAPPGMVKALSREPEKPRVFTPFHVGFHQAANLQARGWQDVRPYYALGEILQPNSNLYWGVASADCYAGLSPRWYVDVWGDHNRASVLVYRTVRPSERPGLLDADPAFVTLMRTYGVTHVISPYAIPVLEPPLPTSPTLNRGTRLYRIADARRVRVVPRAVVVDDTPSAVRILLREGFDPDALVVLHDAPPALATSAGAAGAGERGAARITLDHASSLRIDAEAPSGGFLVLSDTYYPGWTATVNGRPAPIFRANQSVRAVPLPAGKHRVELTYRSATRARGVPISLLSAGTLLAVLAGSLVARRRRPAAPPASHA